MAQYKVIQDIEAEDKLLGPLSMRQFIYAVITVVLLFISFRLFFVQPLLVIPLLFPAILFGVLAAPFGHDQSSEIWLLAKIRFALKPQRRIWDQSGLQEMVSITAPKKMEAPRTNGLNEDQVKSRLEALAQTIDTRGWVVKGVNVNMFTNPDYMQGTSSDRLVDPSSIAEQVPVIDVKANEDILDERNNPVAQQMDQLVKAKDETHRKALLNQMQQVRQSQNQAQGASEVKTGGVFDGPYDEPAQSYVTPAITTVQPTQPSNGPDLSAVEPDGHPLAAITPSPSVATSSNEGKTPAILKLANNNDLTVATIARQANKRDTSSDEVVVPLR